jgi:hypothetical protein
MAKVLDNPPATDRLDYNETQFHSMKPKLSPGIVRSRHGMGRQ